MCLVRIWRLLFWRAFADRHADRGVSRTLLFCPAIFLASLLSIATREAGRVLPAEVYNGSFIFVFRIPRHAEARSIKIQERSDENHHCHALRRSRSECSLDSAESHAQPRAQYHFRRRRWQI